MRIPCGFVAFGLVFGHPWPVDWTEMRYAFRTQHMTKIRAIGGMVVKFVETEKQRFCFESQCVLSATLQICGFGGSRYIMVYIMVYLRLFKYIYISQVGSTNHFCSWSSSTATEVDRCLKLWTEVLHDMAKSQNWGTVKMHDVSPERTQQYAVFNSIKQQQSPVTFY